MRIVKRTSTNRAVANLYISDNNIALLLLTYNTDAETGQYSVLLYNWVPADYRPKNTIRAAASQADNGNIYPAQITTAGSVQTLLAIPANVTETIIATWPF
jgi:hypothetical protein